MLVKIKAIMDKGPDNAQDCYINTKFILSASFVNYKHLRLKMSDGKVFIILHSEWIDLAGKDSPTMKKLFDEFVKIEEDYDSFIDRLAEENEQHIIDYPEDW